MPADQAGQTWTLTKAAAPVLGVDDLLAEDEIEVATVPQLFTGVLGKWDYVASHDVFIGVTNSISGDVWIYKPQGWSSPDHLV